MVRPDDCALSLAQRQLIAKHADKVLRDADAYGVFPTPIDSVMEAAKVFIASEDLADEGLIRAMQRAAKSAGHTLKRALEKVLGIVHVASRLIYLDKTVHVAKLPILKLHEMAHAVLPWQKDIYVVTEDCHQTLAPEIADEFEQEATSFATEVIFQLNTFTREAADHDMNILVPVRLSKSYGASIYSAVRRYVSTHHKACMVLVLEPPQIHEELGFTCDLRRSIASDSFTEQFGKLAWPLSFSPDDQIGASVPVNGKRMSGKRRVTLVDRNGSPCQCLAEAFTQTHQVFILIHSVKTLKKRQVVVCDA